MNDEVTRLLEEADALADEADAGTDEVLARAENYRRRNAPPREMIYKTHEPPPAQASTPTAMTEEQQKPWNEWLDSRVDMVCEIMGQETALLENRLREEITKLRAEVEVLRGKIEGNVTPIGHKNVA